MPAVVGRPNNSAKRTRDQSTQTDNFKILAEAKLVEVGDIDKSGNSVCGRWSERETKLRRSNAQHFYDIVQSGNTLWYYNAYTDVLIDNVTLTKEHLVCELVELDTYGSIAVSICGDTTSIGSIVFTYLTLTKATVILEVIYDIGFPMKAKFTKDYLIILTEKDHNSRFYAW